MLEKAGVERLLAIDPELAAGLDREAHASAHELLRVVLLRLEATDLRGKWGAGSPDLAGYLVAEGALMRSVTTAASTTAELLGPGDIIRPFEEDGEEDLPVSAEIRWTVLSPVVLAVVDGRVLQMAARWPSVLAALVARCILRTQRLAVDRSISHMVRVRDRLVLTFWHLADHWGRVGTQGVTIELALTHSQVALMVGAERPSVSAALSELTREGVVARNGSGHWVLLGEMPENVGTMLMRPGAPARKPATP